LETILYLSFAQKAMLCNRWDRVYDPFELNGRDELLAIDPR